VKTKISEERKAELLRLAQFEAGRMDTGIPEHLKGVCLRRLYIDWSSVEDVDARELGEDVHEEPWEPPPPPSTCEERALYWEAVALERKRRFEEIAPRFYRMMDRLYEDSPKKIAAEANGRATEPAEHFAAVAGECSGLKKAYRTGRSETYPHEARRKIADFLESEYRTAAGSDKSRKTQAFAKFRSTEHFRTIGVEQALDHVGSPVEVKNATLRAYWREFYPDR